MPLVTVKYEGEIKDTVDAYVLNKDAQSGDYWESTEEEVTKVKKHIKEHYKIAQDFTCVYCQQKVLFNHGRVWDIEHIIPKKLYPKFLFTEENLALSCPDCNGRKLDKNVLVNPKRKTFPNKSEDYIIVHPHFDEYEKHIKVLDNQLYFPKDEKGIKTIEICGLLRFAYKFSNYGTVALDVKRKMMDLTQALLGASTAIEENYILGCISDLTEYGQKKSRESHLKNL